MPPIDNQTPQPAQDPAVPQPPMGQGPDPVAMPQPADPIAPPAMPAPDMAGPAIQPPQPVDAAPATPTMPGPMDTALSNPAPEPAPMAAPMQPEPVATPLQPAPAPMPDMQPSPLVAPAPVVNDPTQPGYVPPANPTAMPMMGANDGKKSGSKMRLIRIVIAVVVSLVVLSGGGLLLKDTLFSGSKIKVGDLVDDSAESVSFKRPKNWTKASEQTSTDGTVFSEDGKAEDESDQQMYVSSTSLGVSFDDLPQTTKDQLINKLLDTSNYEGSSEGCEDVGEIKATKTTQPNYSAAIRVEVTCNKFTSRALKAQLKAVVGIKGSYMNIVGISAVDKTWDKSGDTLETILDTFKPAS